MLSNNYSVLRVNKDRRNLVKLILIESQSSHNQECLSLSRLSNFKLSNEERKIRIKKKAIRRKIKTRRKEIKIN